MTSYLKKISVMLGGLLMATTVSYADHSTNLKPVRAIPEQGGAILIQSQNLTAKSMHYYRSDGKLVKSIPLRSDGDSYLSANSNKLPTYNRGDFFTLGARGVKYNAYFLYSSVQISAITNLANQQYAYPKTYMPGTQTSQYYLVANNDAQMPLQFTVNCVAERGYTEEEIKNRLYELFLNDAQWENFAGNPTKEYFVVGASDHTAPNQYPQHPNVENSVAAPTRKVYWSPLKFKYNIDLTLYIEASQGAIMEIEPRFELKNGVGDILYHGYIFTTPLDYILYPVNPNIFLNKKKLTENEEGPACLPSNFEIVESAGDYYLMKDVIKSAGGAENTGHVRLEEYRIIHATNDVDCQDVLADMPTPKSYRKDGIYGALQITMDSTTQPSSVYEKPGEFKFSNSLYFKPSGSNYSVADGSKDSLEAWGYHPIFGDDNARHGLIFITTANTLINDKEDYSAYRSTAGMASIAEYFGHGKITFSKKDGALNDISYYLEARGFASGDRSISGLLLLNAVESNDIFVALMNGTKASTSEHLYRTLVFDYTDISGVQHQLESHIII